MDEENKVPQVTTAAESAGAPNGKMTVCKSCGAKIAKSAKTCPSCGAKNKNRKKKLLILAVIALVVIVIIAAASGKDKDAPAPAAAANPASATAKAANATDAADTTQAAPDYETVEIEKLFDELENNAYNAQQKWKNRYITITGGKVAAIDASGQYFSIESKLDDYWLKTVHVSIPREIRDEVMRSISSGADVTVRGKISDVGELLGYTVDALEVIY